MAVMTRWDAFHDLRAVQDEMNYLNRMFAQTGGRELQRPGLGARLVDTPSVKTLPRRDSGTPSPESVTGRCSVSPSASSSSSTQAGRRAAPACLRSAAGSAGTSRGLLDQVGDEVDGDRDD